MRADTCEFDVKLIRGLVFVVGRPIFVDDLGVYLWHKLVRPYAQVGGEKLVKKAQKRALFCKNSSVVHKFENKFLAGGIVVAAGGRDEAHTVLGRSAAPK